MAIDRTSKFAYVELHQKAGKMAAAAFLCNLIAAVPYRIHIMLTQSHGLHANHCRATDNGFQFPNHQRHIHASERLCCTNGVRGFIL